MPFNQTNGSSVPTYKDCLIRPSFNCLIHFYKRCVSLSIISLTDRHNGIMPYGIMPYVKKKKKEEDIDFLPENPKGQAIFEKTLMIEATRGR